ncbi:MAG: DUF805 domain-containing protein [Alphaproteobacteria bacterium]|nr:DUF805 domain-containing protein [Alphaproteobacteria bacterium]
MEYMFLPLKRYAEFSGRSRRMEYWMWTLFMVLLWMVFFVAIVAVAGAAFMTGGGIRSLMAMGGGILVIGALAIIVWLALLIPSLAVGVRRLHDTERSGWWLGGLLIVDLVNGVLRGSGSGGALTTIVSLVVLVWGLVLLVFYCLDGTKGPNKYGPDPKGGVNAEVFA